MAKAKFLHQKIKYAKNSQGFFQLYLGDKPLKTDSEKNVIVKKRSIAQQIVTEWQKQNHPINWKAMLMTRMVFASLDINVKKAEQIRQSILNYASNDLLYYYICSPQSLYDSQKLNWTPLIEYIEKACYAKLPVITGFTAVKPNGEVMQFFTYWLEKQHLLQLIALQQMTVLSGSLVVTINLCRGNIDDETAWKICHLEHSTNEKIWGQDQLARIAYENRKAEYHVAYRFFCSCV